MFKIIIICFCLVTVSCTKSILEESGAAEKSIRNIPISEVKNPEELFRGLAMIAQELLIQADNADSVRESISCRSNAISIYRVMWNIAENSKKYKKYKEVIEGVIQDQEEIIAELNN